MMVVKLYREEIYYSEDYSAQRTEREQGREEVHIWFSDGLLQGYSNNSKYYDYGYFVIVPRSIKEEQRTE